SADGIRTLFEYFTSAMECGRKKCGAGNRRRGRGKVERPGGRPGLEALLQADHEHAAQRVTAARVVVVLGADREGRIRIEDVLDAQGQGRLPRQLTSVGDVVLPVLVDL